MYMCENVLFKNDASLPTVPPPPSISTVLHTYTQGTSDALLHNLHIWIGAESSQDEYGTAA